MPGPATDASASLDASLSLDALKRLDLSDSKSLPEEWKEDPEDVGTNLQRYYDQQPAIKANWDERGVFYSPVHMKNNTGEPRRVACQYGHPQTPADMREPDAAAFVCMTREGSAGHPEGSTDHPEITTFHVKDGRATKEMSSITVPFDEIAIWEAKGWKLWYAPKSPLDPENNYRDIRKIDPPEDSCSTDQPAKDSMRWLERGLKSMESSLTAGPWRQGHLLGPNGSDPAVMAQSPSYASYKDYKEGGGQERRSATSIGHLIKHPRPPGVGVGWGGYDEFIEWQSYGREVTLNMVKKEDWTTDPMEPLVFKNEAGEVTDTFPSFHISKEDLPAMAQEPISLYDRLASQHRDQSHPDDEQPPTTPAWPGTYLDE
ncbi:hypothetical protein ACHAQA_009564 [Verticillium albo-atrum]